MTARKIILDCDPGHDDAIALLVAHGDPRVDLVAVTTVAGNQTIDKITRNALAVGRIAGITGVPFARGAERPLVRSPRIAPDIHGDSGLDGPVLPEPVIELDPRPAAQLIVDTVMAHPAGAITLVPTGPLTNIALAARLEPRIVDRVREVVLMGGGVGVGNTTAAAEFNIVVDPEAAHVVFDAGWAVTMVGLDLTHQAIADDAVAERITAIGTAPARFVGELLDFFRGSYRHVFGFPDGPPVHDACAVAFVIDPDVMTTRAVPITVELHGEHTAGMTVADLRRPALEECRTRAAVTLDRDRFWDLVVGAVKGLGDPS
ncbi:nucleoside hydrolase [Diaminobutyricimonas aerilata]|uniref:uridine-preferring nucleoside hydrolase UriH n=1 Tax=Diaminobutyricimonas aerilata TaxID=1162967 RepID=UPI000C23E3EC|nr:nucleoside hydrolase [Diaminobutyricimonas aerilata]